MDSNYTRIVIILDRSGSMEDIRKSTISSFNEFLSEQKKLAGYVKLQLVQFDTEYQVDYNLPLNEVPKLTWDTFVPRGGTALYDAIGRTINELGVELATLPEDRRPSKVMIVTITDGEENRSKEFRRENIASLIKNQTDKYSWDFVFLAANQDAIVTARQFNISPQKAMTFNSNAASVMGMTKGLNNYVSTYRSFDEAKEATKCAAFSESDREKSVQ